MDALLDMEALKAWWGVDSVLIEKKDGGLYCLTWLKSEHGIKFISTGRIKLYDRNSHLYLEDMVYINSERPILGPFNIEFSITPALDGYYNLSVKQGGFEKGQKHAWYYEAVSQGWPEALLMLKTYLEKK